MQKSQKSTKMQFACRLQTFMGHKEKQAMINTFAHLVHSKESRDKYFFCAFKFQLWACLVFGTSVVNKKSPKLQNKVEKIHERSLKFLTSLDNDCTVRNSREKTSFTPAGNFAKLFDTPREFQGQKPKPAWKFHMGFS